MNQRIFSVVTKKERLTNTMQKKEKKYHSLL